MEHRPMRCTSYTPVVKQLHIHIHMYIYIYICIYTYIYISLTKVLYGTCWQQWWRGTPFVTIINYAVNYECIMITFRVVDVRHLSAGKVLEGLSVKKLSRIDSSPFFGITGFMFYFSMHFRPKLDVTDYQVIKFTCYQLLLQTSLGNSFFCTECFVILFKLPPKFVS